MKADKRELRFVVNGQKIVRDPRCDFSDIVSGTKKYLVASFKFSEEWSNAKDRIVVFSVFDEKFNSILNKNDECVIPDKALIWSSFNLRVIGKTKNGQILCTDNITIDQKVVR